MLAFVMDQSTRQILGEVDTSTDYESAYDQIIVEDSHGFATVKNPMLVGEVGKGKQFEIVTQPLFWSFPVSEIKVKVSSYFIIQSEEIKAIYQKQLEIYRAYLSGLVITNSMPSGNSVSLTNLSI